MPDASEGTIQFAYELTPGDHPLEPDMRAELAAWRSILYQLDLIGQAPDRYAGFAYGNLSVRTAPRSTEFVITASQTSGEATLDDEHLVHVTHCNTERFWIDARGESPPSSEAVTHAMVYAADARVNCVLHVHTGEIWRHTQALKLPFTPLDIGYGTPALADAVAELLDRYQSRPIAFATAGHEDGIFACGHSPRDCGALLVATLAKARQL